MIMSHREIEIGRIDDSRRRRESGFSMIELIVVLVILGILSAISIPYLYHYKKLYKSEDQAIKVMDMMREAAQLALTHRRTFRFEIDLTDNTAKIIDERGVANPDLLVKSLPLEPVNEVRMDVIPGGGVTRPNPPNYTDAVFAADALGHDRIYGAPVIGDMVWAGRFRSDGSVVNAANLPISATIYSWPPLTPGSPMPRQRPEIRAITLFGGSGAVRYWKHTGTTFTATQ